MLSVVARLVSLGYKTARRIVVGIVGASIVCIGVAMLVLPGPAIVVIPTGLAVLALEFEWARRLLKRVREQGAETWRALGGGSPSSSDPAPSPDPEPRRRD